MNTIKENRQKRQELYEIKEKKVKEYRETHKLPSRGHIDGPEIFNIKEQIKALDKEYLLLIKEK